MLLRLERIQKYRKPKIFSQADIEKTQILADASVDIAKLQALVGAVQAQLDAKTDSERIEAAKHVRIAEAEAVASIMKARAPVDIAQAKSRR